MTKALFTVNGSIIFTRDYEDGWVNGDRRIPQGTRAIVTRVHKGALGDATHVDNRLSNGRFIRQVEVNYFAV